MYLGTNQYRHLLSIGTSGLSTSTLGDYTGTARAILAPEQTVFNFAKKIICVVLSLAANLFYSGSCACKFQRFDSNLL